MMKHQNLRRNLILSAGLLVVYTATFLIAMAVGRPVETLNFIATAGVAAGAALILSWLPFSYYAAIVLFACAAQYFGMMFDFYHMFWWYDIVIHFLSGILLGAMGHFLCRLLCKKNASGSPHRRVCTVCGLFCRSLCRTVGNIRILLRCLFRLETQSSGAQSAIDDTMQDIIAGTVSAALYGCGLALFLRKSDPAKSFICLAGASVARPFLIPKTSASICVLSVSGEKLTRMAVSISARGSPSACRTWLCAPFAQAEPLETYIPSFSR